ncbi:MAG: peptide chain release factor N(5)-glutamine methyltransferase [Planctomycetota bacterium]
MSTVAPWTVGRLLQWTADYLKSRGADSPRLDAEILLAEALSCQRIQLYTTFEDVPHEEKRAAFRELVRRRAEGTPVAYLVGRREFYSLSFKVGPGVLIPRPETELIVVALLDLAKQRTDSSPLRIADVGTGSGILAVTLAKRLPAALFVATDTSKVALEIAAENARQHGVAERVQRIECDLLTGVEAEPKFDFIVSNPPYISTAEYEKLPRDVKDFEPREALLAGPKGTEVIERLILQATERLRPGGHLLIEISPMIHSAVQALLAASPGLQPGPTVKDLARLPRVVQARRV